MKQSKTQCIWIAFFIVLGCALPERGKPVTIQWENNRAVALSIPNSLVQGFSSETLSTDILVSIGDSTNQPILGEFIQEENAVIFKSLVPFTRGMHYHVTYQMKLIGDFTVPIDENASTPKLNIYPSQDTLPENLLKMYFDFSESMVEGQSLRHVHLVDNTGDTLAGTFLDLQPELWNTEGTRLTLWLDPGRIKRDLIPNKEMGNPLTAGMIYSLQVSAQWKSKSGVELGQPYSKTFIVGGRDEEIPSVQKWRIEEPRIDSRALLTIKFQEPLDFSLITDAIRILDSDGNVVEGPMQPANEEKSMTFIPANPWEKGKYTLLVESRLEDLAGNNLTRPFDRDLNKASAQQEKAFYKREFVIQ